MIFDTKERYIIYMKESTYRVLSNFMLVSKLYNFYIWVNHLFKNDKRIDKKKESIYAEGIEHASKLHKKCANN